MPEIQSCVLLAEDDGELRSLLAQALRRDGHRVIEASDGSELLEQIASDFVDEGVWRGSTWSSPTSACRDGRA